MSRRIILTSFLGAQTLLIPAAACPAHAADTVPWIISEASGTAQQQNPGGSWTALAAGSVLVPGAEVRTGSDGRLALSHGKDRVTVSPSSEFAVPRGADPATGPSMIQRLGTLLFRIEHRPDRHFEVDGPYLAAVVKGTVFTVNAGALDGEVHVAEGAVQVSAPLAHRTELIRPGQTAMITSSGKSMSILGRPTPGKAVQQRSDADVPSKSAGDGGEAASADRSKSDNAVPADPSTSKMKTVDAGPAEKGPRITRTLGDAPLDTAALSSGLVGRPIGTHGLGGAFKASAVNASVSGGAEHGPVGHGAASASASAAFPGNGIGNAGGAAFTPGSGNPGVGGGAAFVGMGNVNAGGGNAFAGAGNAGNASAGGANAIAALGIPNSAANSNAHGGNPNAGGPRH